MYMKECPGCKKKAYSASDRGEWSCPHCNEDLTDLEAKIPDNNNDNEKGEK